jgi:hypothetical protein
MSRSAERIAKLRQKLAALEDDPTVVEIFGGPTLYFSERARKLREAARQRANAGRESKIATPSDHGTRSRQRSRP